MSRKLVVTRMMISIHELHRNDGGGQQEGLTFTIKSAAAATCSSSSTWSSSSSSWRRGGGDFLIHVSNSLNQNLTLQRLYLPPSFFLLMALGHLKQKYLFEHINFNLPESFQNQFGRFDVHRSFCTCTYLRTLDVLRGFEFHKRPE